MNKEFNRMLKLAGLMTEGLYTAQMYSEEPVMEAPMKKMTKEKLKEKIRGMMNQEGYMGTPYDSSDDMALGMIKTGAGLPGGTMEEAPGDIATREMGSMDEYDTQGLTNAASVVDYFLKMAYDAGSTGVGFDDNLSYDMMDHLKQFSGEMGGMNEASYEASERMDGLAPVAARRALVSAARMIIGALKRDGFEEEDIHDYLLDLITTLPMEEDLFEAKGDEESETEDVIVAKDEVPAKEAPAEDVTDTTVDIDMDGTPDIDAGSSESKAAFNKLTDAYRAAKELGDEKLIRQLANTITYFNKNIILDTNTVG
jgi:hypothetical protein